MGVPVDKGKFDAGLSSLIGESNAGCMAGKWIAIFQTIEPDGKTALSTAYSEDMTGWDVLGFLHFALQRAERSLWQIDQPEDDE